MVTMELSWRLDTVISASVRPMLLEDRTGSWLISGESQWSTELFYLGDLIAAVVSVLYDCVYSTLFTLSIIIANCE